MNDDCISAVDLTLARAFGCFQRYAERGEPRVANEYGHVTWGSRKWAHRVVYEATHGPIPPGKCVLHSCDNPVCVNPAHLHLGTKGDNQREMADRGRGRNQFAGATHCAAGHEFTEANTQLVLDRNGRVHRHCRSCKNARKRAARHRR